MKKATLIALVTCGIMSMFSTMTLASDSLASHLENHNSILINQDDLPSLSSSIDSH